MSTVPCSRHAGLQAAKDAPICPACYSEARRERAVLKVEIARFQAMLESENLRANRLEDDSKRLQVENERLTRELERGAYQEMALSSIATAIGEPGACDLGDGLVGKVKALVRDLERLTRERGTPTDEPDMSGTHYAQVRWWKDHDDALQDEVERLTRVLAQVTYLHDSAVEHGNAILRALGSAGSCKHMGDVATVAASAIERLTRERDKAENDYQAEAADFKALVVELEAEREAHAQTRAELAAEIHDGKVSDRAIHGPGGWAELLRAAEVERDDLRAETCDLTGRLEMAESERDALRAENTQLTAEMNRALAEAEVHSIDADVLEMERDALRAVLEGIEAWLVVRASDHTYKDGSLFVALTLEKLAALKWQHGIRGNCG